MSESMSTDPVARLEAAVERWERDLAGRDAAMAQALEEMRAQAASLQAQLAAQPPLDATAQAVQERDARIAALEATVARLEEELRVRDTASAAEHAAAEEREGQLHAALRERETRIATLEYALQQQAAPPSVQASHSIPAFDERGHKKRMGQILVDLGIATADELNRILAEQAAHPQRRFGMIAVSHGLTDEELIGRIIAAQSRLPFQRLSDDVVDPATVRLLNRELAHLYEAVPIRESAGRLTVAMANPMDLIAIENIELATNRPVDPVVATPRDIDITIKKHVRH